MSTGYNLPAPQAPRRSPQKGICTRCGTSAPEVWMCGKCRSKVTVIARQTREALEPEYLETRRRQGRIYMRKVRAAEAALTA